MSLLRRLLVQGPHTCPWWFAYAFDNPLRRWAHDPEAILGPFVEPRDTAVDIGCGLGYFSLALAELVGPEGQVVALDIQREMLRRASGRAERRGLADRIDFRLCVPDRLGFAGSADFVLAFWVVHEVADPEGLLAEVSSFLEPDGRLLIVEPRGHVPAARFSATVELARDVGFDVTEGPGVRLSRSVVCSMRSGPGG